MKIARISSIVFFFCFFAASICLAQEVSPKTISSESSEPVKVNREDALALARTYVQAQRQTIVAANLQLTPEESSAFWPVYKEYQNGLEPLRDRLVKLIVAYSEKFETLSDEDAKAMLDEMLSIPEAESKVRSQYVSKFEAVLPIKKVARFYQIDNKITAEIRYGLSLEIPLLEAVK